MDNLTHSLTGLALARAGLSRFYSRPILVLIVAANLPDIDMCTMLGGSLNALEYHRGITHSLPALPFMALFPVLLAMLFARSRAGLLGAYFISVIGLASHLLLDWTNDDGIRLLLPFSGTWFHGDLNSLVDLWIWAVLLLAALAPLLGRLVSSEIGAKPGSGKGLAIFALLFIVAFDYGRFLMHERAIAALNTRVYDGALPLRTAAFPLALNPFRWICWVDTDRLAIRYDLNVNQPFDPASGTRFYKPEMSPAIQAAAKTRPFRGFSGFDLYPLYAVVPAGEPEGATRVELHDERFPFVATAIVDRDDRVVDSSFHY